MRCGGLNGCPISTRSGCSGQPAWIALGNSPEELDASTTSGLVARSSWANSACFRSIRSGPFSCTKSASPTAVSTSAVKVSRSVEAPSTRPISVSTGQCAATSARSRSSALGEGSVATTSSPCARKCATQLAPMTPVPTTATRRTSLPLMLFSWWWRAGHTDPGTPGRPAPHGWRRHPAGRRAGSSSPAAPASYRSGSVGSRAPR